MYSHGKQLLRTETTEADPFDDSQASEFDDLKHQALEFGQEVVDDLDVLLVMNWIALWRRTNTSSTMMMILGMR